MPRSCSFFRGSKASKKEPKNPRQECALVECLAQNDSPQKPSMDNIELARLFSEASQRHDADTAASLATPNCLMIFDGPDEKVEYNLEQFKDDVFLVYASFPDFTITWDSIEEIRPGVVVVDNWQVSGTHTGTPYSFGPYPTIPAKGIFCKNDLEKFVFYCKDNVIYRIEVHAYGPLTGLAGLYQQIGGIIM